jgi:hypothetical protein
MTENFDARTTALLQNLAVGRVGPLAQLLAPGHVVILVGMDALRYPQGQLLVSMAVNLAARLSPVVQRLSVALHGDHKLLFSPPRFAHATLAGHLETLLESLPNLVSWSIGNAPPESYDVGLVIGVPAGKVRPDSIFIGSDGWEVSFSPRKPMAVGPRANPVGAYAAACIGIAELWKRLLISHQGIFKKAVLRPQTEPLTFSTLTYLSCSGVNPELPPTIKLGRLSVIGVGAGGGAALFTLASLEDVRGHLNLVDPDEIERSNLNRYVMADVADADMRVAKVTLGARLLAAKNVTIAAYPLAQEECKALQPADYKRVLSAVHTREARRLIQWETPGVLWDAGATQDGDFRIWRMIMGQTECMFCKHPPGAEDVEHQKAAQLAKLLKLEKGVCLRKIRNNEVFTEEEIDVIKRAIEDEALRFDLPRPSQRFGDWEAEQCGKLKLPDLDDEVPIPFAPVLAGILIAGELIKELSFPEHVLDSRYSNTLMGQFMTRSRPIRIAPRADCRFCNAPAIRKQFERRQDAK